MRFAKRIALAGKAGDREQWQRQRPGAEDSDRKQRQIQLTATGIIPLWRLIVAWTSRPRGGAPRTVISSLSRDLPLNNGKVFRRSGHILLASTGDLSTRLLAQDDREGGVAQDDRVGEIRSGW
ncbi:MAG: hypothetical protein GY906_09110 [bacterium]|nr:hypothetical protein [bacterium]